MTMPRDTQIMTVMSADFCCCGQDSGRSRRHGVLPLSSINGSSTLATTPSTKCRRGDNLSHSTSTPSPADILSPVYSRRAIIDLSGLLLIKREIAGTIHFGPPMKLPCINNVPAICRQSFQVKRN